MIKQFGLESTGDTYIRLFQKIQFGAEILNNKFFDEKEIKDCDNGYRLNVYQYNKDIRFFYMNKIIYSVNTEEPLYNYLDTGRAIIIIKPYSHYVSEQEKATVYIFNDLIITDKEVIDFEEYRDKESMNLKKIMDNETFLVYLVYAEDLQKIKSTLDTLRAERKAVEENTKIEKIQNEKEAERLFSLLNNYDKMTLLEDENAIIKDNYFIDKNQGIKIEFNEKITKIFSKDNLIDTSYYKGGFIKLDYSSFIQFLIVTYELTSWRGTIEEKVARINKEWLNFKIYSYNKETKEEKFLKEIRIKNIKKEEKLRFEVNDIKIPKQKMAKLFGFLQRIDSDNLDRIINFEKYAEQIKLYSGIQLSLLNGKDIDINICGARIPLHFNLIAEDKENWKVSFNNFSINKPYKEIRESFYRVYGGGLDKISEICESLHGGSKLEEILITHIKEYVEKRRLAEERAEQLFKEFLDKNKTRVFKKDDGYIIKGKLKNYIVKMKDKDNAGVWTYPAKEYVCINQKTRAGQYLCKYDKLLQFAIVMLNDGLLKEEINTIN